MWLEKIDIQHFRNYTEASVSFSPHLNIFLGRNAQGKTNILEAIYFLALTRSHRTRSDKELIQFQQNALKLNGIVHRYSGNLVSFYISFFILPYTFTCVKSNGF